MAKPDFLVSGLLIKPILQKDTFELKNISTNSLIDTISNISFCAKKKNRFEQGQEIADELRNALKENIAGVSSEEFKKTYAKIDDKNVVPTIKAFSKTPSKRSLIGAICAEVGNSKETRKDAINGIVDRLVNLGKRVGVQTEHYKSRFDEELDEQFDTVLLPVKVKQLDKISGAFVQAIENKASITPIERNELKLADIKTTQTYTTKILQKTVQKAEKSLKAQQEYDGWSAKIGESIRKLWGSQNQVGLVKEDIDKFKNQVSELDKVKGTKEYNNKFKEIFNVNYDPELIAKYQEKEEKFILASLCTTVEHNFKNSVSDLIKGKPLADKLLYSHSCAMPVVAETRQQMYDRNFNAFAEFIGKGNVKKGSEELKKTMKDYKINEKSSLNEKYQVLQKMANKYARRLNQNTKNALKKENLHELKKDYENSYYAAFGVDNDIAKRVEDYSASQKWAELLIQDGILCAASIPIWVLTAGTGIIPTLKIAAMHSAADLLVYGSDRLVSKQGMTEKELKETLKWTAIDGVTAIANQLCYKGIEALVSPISKMSGKAAQITNMALSGVADVGVDCAMEYLGSGKITMQGIVYSVLFTAGGQIVDLKVEGKA